MAFLYQISDIATGLNYRQKDLSNNSNHIPIIQVKDIKNNALTKNTLFFIKKECIDRRFLLKFNDVLLASKGNRNFAYLYLGEPPTATASSTFFILRIIRKDILPDYLVWYLNSKTAQDFFSENVHGTFIPNISKAAISQMKIPIPDLETQQTIVKLDNLQKLEKSLTDQITGKRSDLLNEFINRKLKNNNEY